MCLLCTEVLPLEVFTQLCWLAVGRHLECLVFSIGKLVFLYPELQFDFLGCFLYRLVALMVARYPNLCVFVLLRCWAAYPGYRENQ